MLIIANYMLFPNGRNKKKKKKEKKQSKSQNNYKQTKQNRGNMQQQRYIRKYETQLKQNYTGM